MIPDQTEKLRKLMDGGRVLTGMDQLVCYAYDASMERSLPEAVVQPLEAEEVAAVLRFANQEGVPVVPRGRATSLSGGPVPVRRGIVLDLSRMNRLLRVDAEDLVAVVSPGVVTADLHQAAEQAGLFYPPDPSSSRVCTIGGNLAENAGGPRGLKYGVTKDYALGLEIVTADGRIVRTGGRTFKNVTGYDLTKLIVGSEGTLAVITEATLKLIPKPPASRTVMAVFDDLVKSGEAISAILAAGILPAKIEMMDQACIRAVEAFEPRNLPVEAEAAVLIELDGHPDAIAGEMDALSPLLSGHGATQVVAAESKAQADALWRARQSVSPAIARIKPGKISEDICVAKSKIPQAFASLREIGRRHGLNLVVFGHAGDGNLHPNILIDPLDKEEMARADRAVDEIFRLAVALGGTLSGEHGIGTTKAPYLELELGKEGVELLRALKQAWDPNHILNPGKIF